ncbi:unnamed protein product [Vitrella brassicaformis CCMP3155]|uniref:Uncharacterized protein n=1 Tax=Vitrella brassicaformis (strain CCMP3155) TaxID=1169540 RepID=A0A0G4GK50_VITBC|nr:unnamed protein product [Vitrella brassicaformis CCMP3155]|eukprot:CEM30310.1 unnamed protein product [Vitrella brassicaformis CCMP3155]
MHHLGVSRAHRVHDVRLNCAPACAASSRLCADRERGQLTDLVQWAVTKADKEPIGRPGVGQGAEEGDRVGRVGSVMAASSSAAAAGSSSAANKTPCGHQFPLLMAEG